MDRKPFDIRFKWIGAPTWILTIDDLKIGCDPVLCPKDTVQNHGPGFSSKRLTDPVYDENDFNDVDIWLISHEHLDHLDEYGLAVIGKESHIVANKKAEKVLAPVHPENLNIAQWGQELSYQIKDMTIEIKTIPTVHANNFLVAFMLGGGNGYWLTIKKGNETLEIYVTGDTVCHKKVIDALPGLKADILIPNIGAPFKNSFGGPFTFTIASLQPVIDSVNPDLILPVHFGTFSHFNETGRDVQNWKDERVKIFAEGDCYRN